MKIGTTAVYRSTRIYARLRLSLVTLSINSATPDLEGRLVCEVCVVVKQIRFARELHSDRLRCRVVPLSSGRCTRMPTAVKFTGGLAD